MNVPTLQVATNDVATNTKLDSQISLQKVTAVAAVLTLVLTVYKTFFRKHHR